MRKTVIALSGVLLLATSCFAQKGTVTVTNLSGVDLTDKIVTLSRKAVGSKTKQDLVKMVAVAYDASGKALPSQCDDLNGDGTWDELAFLVDIKANAKMKVQLKVMPAAQAQVFPKRTNIRFGQKKKPYAEITTDKRLKSDDSPTISEIYQMEGPAWENDVVGFRNYYDARNGIDIFGKRTKEMVLDSVGIRGQNYHEIGPWGMDVLKVANSLGAGAIALTLRDSVYRVGPCAEGKYRFVAEGPVRAMFELTYRGVAVGSRLYEVRHCIELGAGNAYYSSKVYVTRWTGEESLTTGVVNKHGLPLLTDNASGYKIFGTIGDQAFNHETLALGLLVPESQFVRNYTSRMTGPGVTETYLADLKVSEGEPYEYHFFAGWELQDAGYKSQDYFMAQMKKAAAKLAAKVVVK